METVEQQKQKVKKKIAAKILRQWTKNFRKMKKLSAHKAKAEEVFTKDFEFKWERSPTIHIEETPVRVQKEPGTNKAKKFSRWAKGKLKKIFSTGKNE